MKWESGGATWNRTSDLSPIRENWEISLRLDLSPTALVLLISLRNFGGGHAGTSRDALGTNGWDQGGISASKLVS